MVKENYPLTSCHATTKLQVRFVGSIVVILELYNNS
jgi:hypothetical protein